MRTKFLGGIAKLVIKKPWVVLSLFTIITSTSIVISLTNLKINTDQDDLVSEKIDYHRRYKEYLNEFGDLEYIYAVIEVGDNITKTKEFVRYLGAKLKEIPDVKEVTYQVSNPNLEKGFLLYLPIDQIEIIAKNLPKMQAINSLADAFAMMNREIKFTKDSKKMEEEGKQLETGFKFLDGLLDSMVLNLKEGKPYKSFLQQAFFATDRAYDEDGFLLSENGRLLFIMIMPQKNYKTIEVIKEPLRNIRAVLDDARKTYPDIKAGLTGRPVLAADEMSISNQDMTIATIAALFIVTLIFALYFRRLTRPIMATIALTFGIAQTFGLTTIVIGHLNILSIVFAVILVGAGMEFGLQIISRYREELALNKDVRHAISVCITQTGKGNTTAALTTAAAFFAMCFTDFLALQELGFIAGSGIILCLINMFFVLPSLMFLRDRGKHPEKLHTTLKIKLDILKELYSRPLIVVTILTVFTIIGIYFLKEVKFNHNLLDLQAKELESVKYEKKILDESSQSTWYVPFTAYTKEESLALAERLQKLPSIGRVETIKDVVPENQQEKIKLISKSRSILKPSAKHIQSQDNKQLVFELALFQKNTANLSEMAFSAGQTSAVEALEEISEKISTITNYIGSNSNDRANLIQFESDFIADLQHHIDILRDGLNPKPITLNDMPDSIKRRFISPFTGRFAIYAYPKHDIWQPQHMKEFIKDVRLIDPNVTGTPVEVFESSRLLEKSFREAAYLSMLAIILIVAIDFRNLKISILALAPLFLGVLWLLGLMGLLGARFNLANFFGIPILLGVGVDNAVQIMHRFKSANTPDHPHHGIAQIMTHSTGTAVLLTSITTLASFGTLVFARHNGIASLGAIMALGTITCFIGSMIALPCLINLLRRLRWI